MFFIAGLGGWATRKVIEIGCPTLTTTTHKNLLLDHSSSSSAGSMPRSESQGLSYWSPSSPPGRFVTRDPWRAFARARKSVQKASSSDGRNDSFKSNWWVERGSPGIGSISSSSNKSSWRNSVVSQLTWTLAQHVPRPGLGDSSSSPSDAEASISRNWRTSLFLLPC